MNSSSSRKSPRRLKPYVAALAACAALAGGGQLLLPASVGAMVDDGGGCTYQDNFWIDQFICFNSDDTGSGGSSNGGGGGSGDFAPQADPAPAPAPQPAPAPKPVPVPDPIDPRCDGTGIYCSKGKAPGGLGGAKPRDGKGNGGPRSDDKAKDNDTRPQREEGSRGHGSGKKKEVASTDLLPCRIEREVLYFETQRDCDEYRRRWKYEKAARCNEYDEGLNAFLNAADFDNNVAAVDWVFKYAAKKYAAGCPGN